MIAEAKKNGFKNWLSIILIVFINGLFTYKFASKFGSHPIIITTAYTVVGTDANGCVASQTNILNPNPTPFNLNSLIN